MFLDPVQHKAVSVQPMITLEDQEAIVVYRDHQAEDGSPVAIPARPVTGTVLKEMPPSGEAVSQRNEGQGQITSRIVYGPTQFFPAAYEWFHDFKWIEEAPKDTDPNKMNLYMGNSHRHEQYAEKHKLKCSKLFLGTQHKPFTLPAVRTKDDIELELLFNVHFQICDAPCMFEATQNPMEDINQALRSLAAELLADKTFEELQASSKMLNGVDNFTRLCKHTRDFGVEIRDISFGGYKMSHQMEVMYAKALQDRAALQIQLEAAQQEQNLHDLRLGSELERSMKQHEMAELQQRHKAEIGDMEHAHQLELRRSAAEQELHVTRAANEETLRVLKELGSQGVDVTAFLVANGGFGMFPQATAAAPQAPHLLRKKPSEEAATAL